MNYLNFSQLLGKIIRENKRITKFINFSEGLAIDDLFKYISYYPPINLLFLYYMFIMSDKNVSKWWTFITESNLNIYVYFSSVLKLYLQFQINSYRSNKVLKLTGNSSIINALYFMEKNKMITHLKSNIFIFQHNIIKNLIQFFNNIAITSIIYIIEVIAILLKNCIKFLIMLCWKINILDFKWVIILFFLIIIKKKFTEK